MMNILTILENDIEKNQSNTRYDLEVKKEAIQEIKHLKEQLEWCRSQLEENNRKRLKRQDAVLKGMEIYGELCRQVKILCRQVRDYTGENFACGSCVYDGLEFDECPGYDVDDCFKLDTSKYLKEIFEVKK